jgi:hypothetical protein
MDPISIGLGAANLLGGLFGKKKKVSYQPLDINKIISDARTQAAENYRQSFDLERQYNPQQAALREQGNAAIQSLLSGTTSGQKAYGRILDDVVSGDIGAPNQALSESSDSILASLKLGGNLDAETQNAVVRSALQGAGAAGIAGSVAGRGLVARDIGLTSLQLLNARQQAALQAGQALSADESARRQFLLGRAGAGATAAATDASRILGATNVIDSRALPSAGLDPGAVASLYIADHNAKNQINATNTAIGNANRSNLIDSILGFGSTLAGAGVFGKVKTP